MHTHFLGIDIAKSKFDCALLRPDGKVRNKVLSNNALGFDRAAARGMRGRTFTVGILLVEIGNPFIPEVVEGINDILSPSEFKSLMGMGRSHMPVETSLIEQMIDFHMDGLILVAPRMSGAVLALPAVVAVLVLRYVLQEVFEVGEPGLAPLRMPSHTPKAWRDLPLWRRPVALAAAVAAYVVEFEKLQDRLVEMNYGEWDGTPIADVPIEVWRQWRSDPEFKPPGGESLHDVSKRVASLMGELLLSDDLAIVVSHVSPIKAALTWALGAPDQMVWRMFIDVASISSIGMRQGAPCRLGFNETAHLR